MVNLFAYELADAKKEKSYDWPIKKNSYSLTDSHDVITLDDRIVARRQDRAERRDDSYDILLLGIRVADDILSPGMSRIVIGCGFPLMRGGVEMTAVKVALACTGWAALRTVLWPGATAIIC
jgi:hypothetical protein